MKKLYFFNIAVYLVLGAAGLGSACSDSGDTETIYVKTPALADRTVKAGETGKFEFEAFDSWTLTSSAAWCQLSAESGAAGNQSVNYTVADTGASFEKSDVADLTLTIGSETFAFKMTRAALERELKVYNDKGQEVPAVVLDSNGAEKFHADITVAANFPWDLEQTTGWPEWLEKPGRLSPVQDADTKLYTLNFTLRIALDKLNTRGTESTLTFSDLNNTASTVTVPVRYFGAEPGFFIAECELGQEITVSKAGFIYDKDGTLTDKNTFDITVVGGEGLKFVPVNIGHTPTYGEDAAGSKAWVSCSEIVTRSAFGVKNLRVTLNSVTPPFGNPNEPTVTIRTYLCLIPPSIYQSGGMWDLAESYWTMAAGDTYLMYEYDKDNFSYKTYSVREEFVPYVFTINVKDALE